MAILHQSSWLVRKRDSGRLSSGIYTGEKKRWQPVRWKVKGRRKRFIKSRDGLGEGRWGGGVSRSCTCNFYVDDSLQVKDELTLPDGVTVKDGTFFSPSWFKMFRHSRSLCTTSHLRNIYVFIYLFIYFLNFKVFPRSWYTSPVRGDSYYYYVLYKRCMLPFWLRTHTHTHSPGFPKAFKLHLYTVDLISLILCGADVVRPFHGCTGREKNAEFWLQISATEG